MDTQWSDSAPRADMECEFGSLNVVLDLRSPETRFALVNGLCGNLAEAVLQLSEDLDPYFVSFNVETPEELDALAKTGREAFLSSAVHAVVGFGDGFLDAYGFSTREEVEEFYGARLVRGTREQLQNHFLTPGLETNHASYQALALQCLTAGEQATGWSRN